MIIEFLVVGSLLISGFFICTTTRLRNRENSTYIITSYPISHQRLNTNCINNPPYSNYNSYVMSNDTYNSIINDNTKPPPYTEE